MGQYYVAIILGPAGEPKEFIRVWMESFTYGSGCKLMEHSYLKNPYVNAIEYLLSPDGPFWKSRLVWAGDYADTEPDEKENLHHFAYKQEDKMWPVRIKEDIREFRYVVNHTKKIYIDKSLIENHIHPLPILTSEGNGAGGGDFRGTGEEFAGRWARDVISVEREAPEGYEQVEYEFSE